MRLSFAIIDDINLFIIDFFNIDYYGLDKQPVFLAMPNIFYVIIYCIA